MATDVVDDQEMREAQRDYLDFLDDDVSLISSSNHILSSRVNWFGFGETKQYFCFFNCLFVFL